MNKDWDTDHKWTLWYHSVKNNNWDKDSYKKLFSIQNLGDYEILKNTVQRVHLQNCMLFLMKGEILPIWEDPENVNGCSLSFKISGKDVLNDWNMIILNTITSDIYLKDHQNINGLSISPKKEFNIIKIWTKDKVKKYSEHYKEYGTNYSEKNIIIKSHN
tara:strand:- start:253 stop:732 length:480 start_codon:yes stop_codon:yes gene_type:complete